MRTDLRTRPARRALAAALCLAAATTGASAAGRFAIDLPGGAGGGRGVAALMQNLRTAAAQQRRPDRADVATVRTVTSCADDSTPGTLRAVLAQAGSGDTIDLSQLQCSSVTLTQGSVAIMANGVTLLGPGADRLSIVGSGDRVLIGYGSGLVVRALTVRDGVSTVAGYKIAGGACILAAYDVTLQNATVSGCTSTGEGAYGGAILGSTITLQQSTLSGNVAQGSLLKTLTAAYGGGAFAYQSEIRLYDSTVSGNRAQVDPKNYYGHYDTGGGLFSDQGGYVYRSTLSGNASDGTGGGFATHGSLWLLDSTVSSNYAGRRGGGLFSRSPSAILLNNSTIAFNQAVTAGGGVYASVTPSAFMLQSAIVADNAALGGPDIAARLPLTVTGSMSLVRAPAANVTLPPDTLRSDPLLLSLAANGGPTRTHALSAGSPAIDRGNNLVGVDFDQRGPGFPRTLGAAPDIGAFEAPAAVSAPPIVPAPTLSGWGMLLLALALLRAASRRRSSASSRLSHRPDRILHKCE